MVPSGSEELRRLFLASLDLPLNEIDDFVTRECRANPHMQAKLSELLSAQEVLQEGVDDNEPTLEDPYNDQGSADEFAQRHDQSDCRLRHYILTETIASGGTADVFRARKRGDPHGTYAVKILRVPFWTRNGRDRFSVECEALARIDHPNVAKYFESGVSEDGLPFIVMEFVDGMPLDRFLIENRTSMEETLRLFVGILAGAQAAHQRGVIHRDLKPSNVLIAGSDGHWNPKIIDFGISRLTDPTLRSLRPTLTGEVIGSPWYMAPEHIADFRSSDARGDIYSIGILLYESILGRLPYDESKLDHDNLFRSLDYIARHNNAPFFLKLRELFQTRPDVARSLALRLQVSPSRLLQDGKHELGWIIDKSIRREPNERFSTAQEFADDIEAYLQGSVIRSGPQTSFHQMNKVIRQHALVVGIASLVVVAIGLLAVVSTMFASRAIAAEQRSSRKATEAEIVALQMRLMSASLKLDYHDSRGSARILGEVPPELRSVEWNYLHNRLDESALTFSSDSQNAYQSLLLAGHDEWLIGASRRSLTCWGASTGDEIAVWQFPSQQDFGACQFVLPGPEWQRICVISGAQLWTFSVPQLSLVAARENAFPSDVRIATTAAHDSLLFAALANGTISCIDQTTGEALWSREVKQRLVMLRQPSESDGLFAGFLDGTLLVLDPLTGQDRFRRSFPSFVGGTVNNTGDIIALHGTAARVQVYNISTGEMLWNREANGSQWMLRFISDDVLAAGTSESIIILDQRREARASVLDGHMGIIGDMISSTDGLSLFSACSYGLVKKWSLDNLPVRFDHVATDFRIPGLRTAKWNPRRENVIGAATSCALSLIDCSLETPIAIRTIELPALTGFAFHPRSPQIAVIGRGNGISIIDEVSMNVVMHRDYVESNWEHVEYLNAPGDGNLLVVAPLARGDLCLLDESKLEIVEKWSLPSDFVSQCLRVERNGRRVALGGSISPPGSPSRATVFLFDKSEFEYPTRIDFGPGSVSSLDFSESGSTFVATVVNGELGHLMSFETASGVQLELLKFSEAREAWLTKDESRIVLRTVNGSALVVDAASGTVYDLGWATSESRSLIDVNHASGTILIARDSGEIALAKQFGSMN